MMYLVLTAEQTEELFESSAVVAARTIEEVGAGQDLEPGLVLHDELAHELAVEPVEVVQRIDHRVASAYAEEQRDLAEPLLQINDERRSFPEASHVDTEVDRDGGRSSAALGAEEHDRLRLLPAGRRRGSARRCPLQRLVEGTA